MACSADFMAQLDEFEARVTVVMAVLGVGLRATARELGVPVKTVKAAAHSAQTKLEQVAIIAAAGRMCGYRQRVIEAHVSGAARAEEVRAARAHIAACAGCRRSYVRLMREMRLREFQCRASAAFLPLPMLVDARDQIEPTFRVPAVRIESGFMDAGGPRLNRRARVEALRRALVDSR